MDVVKQLDQKFADLDNESKLVITMMVFAQCTVGYRRMLPLNQFHHATSFLRTEACVETAEAENPTVTQSVLEIRELLPKALADAPPFTDDEFRPHGEAFTRDFLWSDTFEEPIWYEIRHCARDAMRSLENKIMARA